MPKNRTVKLYKCKECGQLIAKTDIETKALDKERLPEGLDIGMIFDSFEETGHCTLNYQKWCTIKPLGPYTSALRNHFAFVNMGSIKEEGKVEFSVNDKDSFHKHLDKYCSDGIVFTIYDQHEFGTCPVCGSKKGYSVLHHYPSGDEDYIFYNLDLENDGRWAFNDNAQEELQSFVYIEDSSEINDDYNKLVQRCKNDTDLSTIIQIDKNKVELLSFLKNFLSIKENELSLEKRLFELLHYQLSLNQYSYNTQCKIEKNAVNNLRKQYNTVQEQIQSIVALNPLSLSENWYEKYNVSKPIEPIKPDNFIQKEPAEPLYKKPGLFNKKVILAENEELKNKYERELQEYTKNKSRYEDEFQKWETDYYRYSEEKKEFDSVINALEQKERKEWIAELCKNNEELQQLVAKSVNYSESLSNPNAYIQEMMDQSPAIVLIRNNKDEIQKCTKALTETNQLEQTYLATGILFPKYASLPAVATIYEYLLTGRCSELTGPNGAYNLYESELRSNLIIEKLDVISEKLDEIKANQFALYQVLQSINGQLDKLNSTTNGLRKDLANINVSLNDIKENTSYIAYNTAATAYYSKLNAELTNSLGYLIALK